MSDFDGEIKKIKYSDNPVVDLKIVFPNFYEYISQMEKRYLRNKVITFKRKKFITFNCKYSL